MKLLIESRPKWNEQFKKGNLVLSYNDSFPDLSGYVAQGCFDFTKKAREFGATVWCDMEFYKWNYYAPKINDYLLSINSIVTTGKGFSDLRYAALEAYAKDCKLFVRPNGGDKLFTGFLLDIEEIDEFTQKHWDDQIVIAAPKEIIGEFRFVVEAKNKIEVLGYSLYKYQGNNVEHSSCPIGMVEYVERVINVLSSKVEIPDPLIVVDVAQIPQGDFKVIELNSFSNSGFYATKPEKIVEFIEKFT